MTITTESRRGDAFAKTVALIDDAGEPLVLTDTDLVAQLYRPDKTMLAELVVASDTTPGQYLLTCATSTAEWPLELLKCNIYDTNDESSTDAFYVQVTEQISREIPAVP